MLRRYKEIWYGLAMGASMWALDAMMHLEMHGGSGWRAFIAEAAVVNPTQLFFRSLFVIVSIAFGFTLWKSNRRKCRMEDLQNAVDSFQREIANPLILIAGYSRLLSLKEGWPATQQDIELLREIKSNADKIVDLLKRFPPPGIASSAEKLEISAAAEDASIGLRFQMRGSDGDKKQND